MIVGRKEELGALEKQHSRTGSWTYAVYGRRRVGKTTLLREFCRDKPHVFLTAYRNDIQSMLSDMSSELRRSTGRDDIQLKDSGDLFRALGTIGSDEKTVVVIDEFPDMVRLCPAVPSQLRTFIDNVMCGLNMTLIVCGSSISSMMRELNDGEGPLFNRFTMQMRVLPLEYRDARLLNPGLSEEDRLRIYAIAGGIPYYHLLFGSNPPEETIKELFLGRTPWAMQEPDNIVLMELKPADRYLSVLSAIHGGSTLNAISMATGIRDVQCAKMLEELMFLGIVRKDVCYGMKRKTLYRIGDGMFSFRYDVMERYRSRTEGMDPDAAYENIREEISSFYGHRFEEVCREYVASVYPCRSVDRWWGSAPVTVNGAPVRDSSGKVVTEDGDIDIVARIRTQGSDGFLFGECKFTNKPSGRKELDTLILRSGSLCDPGADRRYVLFSRSGFSDSFRDYAEEHSEVRADLVDMEMFTKWAERR